MAKNRRPPSDAPRAPRAWVWLPALAFLIVPLYEILASFRGFNYVNEALYVHDETLRALAWTCWGAAALLALFPAARRAAEAHLEELARGHADSQRLWVGLCFAGVFGLVVFIKFCQYRGFQWPEDPAIHANISYHFITRGTYENSIMGLPNWLEARWQLLQALYSPVLLLWRHALAVWTMFVLPLASVPAACYAVAHLLTGSSLAGWAAMMLAFSHPFFYELVSGGDPAVGLPGYFLWMIFFALRGSWRVAAAMALLLLACSEEAPILTAGMGGYLVFRLGAGSRRSWVLGLGVVLLSILVWFAEMNIQSSFPDHWGQRNWNYYKQLGGTGRQEDVLRYILGHPLDTLKVAVVPLSRLLPAARMIFHAALLPLLAPAALIPLLLSYVPHGLAVGNMHTMELAFGPVVLASVLWAALCGLERAYRFLSQRGLAAWLAVAALAFSGFGLIRASRSLLQEWRLPLYREGPRMVGLIPREASLWTEQFLLAWVAMRHEVKALPWGAGENFERRNFVPEYVLIPRAWPLHAERKFADRVLTFLAQNRYQGIEAGRELVLLKHPAAGPGWAPPAWPGWPAPDPRLAEGYRAYLLGSGYAPPGGL